MQLQVTFPQTETQTEAPPARCPHCGGTRFGRHGVYQRHVIDPKVETVQVIRYRCRQCGHTQRAYPAGVSRRSQTLAEQVISATLYGLGLSYDRTSAVLQALGCGIVKSTIWENVQRLGQRARRTFRRVPLGRRAVVGMDESQLTVKGEGITVGFVTDPATGQLVGMQVLASREAEVIGAWVTRTAQRLGAEVVVTDELESYKPAAEEAGVEHQLCLAHWRKAMTNRLKRLPGYASEKALIKEALQQLDRPALRTMRWLHRQFAKAPPPRPKERQTPAYALRMLTLDVLENWGRLTCYQRRHKALRDELGREQRRDYTVPTTNNACENAIGRAAKIRYRLMRGYKSQASALTTTFFIASLVGVLAGVPFSRLWS